MRKKKQSEVESDPLVGKYFRAIGADGRVWLGQIKDYQGCAAYGVRLYRIERWLPGGEAPGQTIVRTADMCGWELADSAFSDSVQTPFDENPKQNFSEHCEQGQNE